ncbi:MAG: LysM peptidoglycan-binding domain-containing protein [Phycisphaeraceae bacterium]|nr:LysM peptidoglycan-binding domain-containing protein [Phycisphaeraceae bacterium]
MDHHGGKIAAGLLCLVIVWIIVFWLWTPTEAKISFSTADTGKTERLADNGNPKPRLPPTDPFPMPSRKAETASEPKPVRPESGGVVAPEFLDYTVQPGDTFASIALRYFGSRNKADVIANANPLVDPTRIKAGRILRIPRDPANIQGKPTPRSPTISEEIPTATRTHTVVRGDTLTGISQKYYGTIRQIDFILKANREVLSRADELRPGQVLKIPPAPQ